MTVTACEPLVHTDFVVLLKLCADGERLMSLFTNIYKVTPVQSIFTAHSRVDIMIGAISIVVFFYNHDFYKIWGGGRVKEIYLM